jgi:hypothetical protein
MQTYHILNQNQVYFLKYMHSKTMQGETKRNYIIGKYTFARSCVDDSPDT